MARMTFDLNFPRQPQFPGETKPRISEDDNDSVLDDNILDRTSPEMSPDGHIIRRESFADTSSNFSPRDGGWSEFSFNADPASAQPAQTTSHVFVNQGGNNFMRSDGSHGAAYANQPSTWHPNASPGSCTPTTVYEGYVADYGNKAVQPTYNEVVASEHPTLYAGFPVRPGPLFHPNAALSTSPQSGQDWMSNSSSERMELQAMPKTGRVDSPTYHPNPPLLRRDGIRKKNARFEIPAERTLRTIDHLITQTNDEQEIKELKQQKRLLRNRQAAYALPQLTCSA